MGAANHFACDGLAGKCQTLDFPPYPSAQKIGAVRKFFGTCKRGLSGRFIALRLSLRAFSAARLISDDDNFFRGNKSGRVFPFAEQSDNGDRTMSAVGKSGNASQECAFFIECASSHGAGDPDGGFQAGFSCYDSVADALDGICGQIKFFLFRIDAKNTCECSEIFADVDAYGIAVRFTVVRKHRFSDEC